MMIRRFSVSKKAKDERGALSLEYVLFAAAVVAIGAGLGTYYGNISGFFSTVQMPAQVVL